MPRLILINGAPYSGKDTIARHFYHRYHGPTALERFSRPIKHAFAGMMNHTVNSFDEVFFFEKNKEKKIPTFNVSYRQWQMDFSEKFMKPLYGDDIFGRLLLTRIAEMATFRTVIIPDCGFQIEVDSIPDEYPTLLLRVQRSGFDFSDDSREYVEPKPHWAFHRIENDGTAEELEEKSFSLITNWLETL